MASSPDQLEKGPAAPTGPSQADAGERQPSGDARQQRSGQPVPLNIDDSRASAAYANFFRVMGTPEEVLMDFGVNEHPFGASPRPIPVTHRIITNYYTAKRLLQVLHMTVQHHEAAFGVLETDVQKRARPGALGTAGPAAEAEKPKPPMG